MSSLATLSSISPSLPSRPDKTQVWNFADHFREVGSNWTSFPEYFAKAGFLTYGVGKLYHPTLPPNNDFPRAWTSDAFNSFYWVRENQV